MYKQEAAPCFRKDDTCVFHSVITRHHPHSDERCAVEEILDRAHSGRHQYNVRFGNGDRVVVNEYELKLYKSGTMGRSA